MSRHVLRRARPRSPASAPPSSPRTPAAASCSSPSRRARPRSTTPGSSPPTSTGWSTFTMDTNPEIDGRPRARHRRSCTFFSRIHYGGGAAVRDRPAGRDGGRDRRRRRRASATARFNERSGPPVRRRRAGPPAGATAERRRRTRWTSPYGLLTPAAWVAMFARALHARVRRDERGLRPGRRRRPQARRDQPDGVLLRAADHARGPPGLAAGSSSRCTCSTAARRATAARRSSSPRAERARDLRAAAGRHRGGGAGQRPTTST